MHPPYPRAAFIPAINGGVFCGVLITGLFLWTITFVAMMFTASTIFAQQGGGGPGGQPDIVGEMDNDGDGKVSKAEWNRNEKVFTKYDKNNNGYIDGQIF